LPGGQVAGLVDGSDAAEEAHLDDAFTPHVAFTIAIAAMGIVGSAGGFIPAGGTGGVGEAPGPLTYLRYVI
jgi:hypothetical protein